MWTNVCPINHKQRNKILGTSWVALEQVGWVFFWSGGKEINQTLWPKSRFCHSIRHWELWGPVDWCWGPVEWVGDQLNGYFCDKVERSWSEFAKIRWNPTAKFATLPLTRALYEFGDQLNGLGTSWMGWGPVDWSFQNQNLKINGLSFFNFFDLSDQYWDICKKQCLGTSWMGWGTVDWVGRNFPEAKFEKKNWT